jgi:hypothetical protein
MPLLTVEMPVGLGIRTSLGYVLRQYCVVSNKLVAVDALYFIIESFALRARLKKDITNILKHKKNCCVLH